MLIPDHFYTELTKLQAWLTGWKDAGRTEPPGAPVVWQLRRFIKEIESEVDTEDK